MISTTLGWKWDYEYKPDSTYKRFIFVLFLKILLGSPVSRLWARFLWDRESVAYTLNDVLCVRDRALSMSIKIVESFKRKWNILEHQGFPGLLVDKINDDRRAVVWLSMNYPHANELILASVTLFCGYQRTNRWNRGLFSSYFFHGKDIVASSTPSHAWHACQCTGLCAWHPVGLGFLATFKISCSVQILASGRDSTRLDVVASSTAFFFLTFN